MRMHTLVILALLAVVAGSCRPAANDAFAIYLLVEKLTVRQMAEADLAQIRLQKEPFIGPQDIVSYIADTHEVELTPAAFQRLTGLQVPVSGLPFVACVGSRPVYWGAFWTPLSSTGFAGVTILRPLGRTGPPVIRIERGYPGSDFAIGEDLRSNGQILGSLERAGKLR